MLAVTKVAVLLLTLAARQATCCNFYPVGEYLKFVRIPENLKVGEEVLQVEVHPRKNLVLQPVDREEDVHLFTYRDVNRTHVSVVLAQSVDHLVDSDSPQNVVKFRLGCDFDTGDDLISAFLSVTVYIEDVNDNAPTFLDLPYRVTVDELTPTGLTIFNGIRAFDRDKPNTPNSDVQYSITDGDPEGRFSLESSHKPALVLAKPIDFDAGDREFFLTVTASDRGSPPRVSNATVHVIVADNDDLPPKFTQDVYRTSIPEFYPLLGRRVHRELVFPAAVRAFDRDAGLGAPLRYQLLAGNERGYFSLGPLNATLFLDKEIDLEAETLPGNTFVLQIEAAQVDNPLKTAQARIEVEILDLNDNLPEFEVDFYNISIVENLPNGFSVLQVVATDKDQGDNGEFTYQLSDPEGAFSIDPRSGWLTVRNQTVLDREQHSSLRMKVYAKEKNPSVVGTFLDKQRLSKWRRNPTTLTQPPNEKTTYVFPDKIGTKSENFEYFEDEHQLMSFVTVDVTLLDANDNNPVFVPSNLYEFTVKSNAKIGTYIGNVKAVDPDLGKNGVVFYDLQRTSNLTITAPFQVDAETGVITSAESPILEGRHALFIEASDQPANPSERRYSLAVVTIDVTRSNIDKPDFIGAPYEFWVGSNVGIGTSVGQIRVNEAMEKSEVSYDLLHGYEEGVPFAVEERSGVITVIHELSEFDRPMYEFEAVAIQDRINLTISTNATVHVVDANDERGILLKGTQSPIVFHVKENVAGAIIGQIFNVNKTASSINNTGNIRFIIANQQDVTDDIAIGQDGTIYTQKPLDREKRDAYRMTVIAEFNRGVISGAGIYQVNIYVDDENDNPPIFDMPVYEGFIMENAKKGTEVKMTNKIRALDADIGHNAVFSYTLFGDGHDSFHVNEETGVVTYIGSKLDREEKGLYILKVVARDKGSLKSEAKLTITVLDENDNEPKYNQIIIPLGENVDLLEKDDKSDLKIYREWKNDVNSGVTKIEVKPKNKFLTTNAKGPLFTVPENIAIGSTILKLNAIDMDSGANGQIRYEFVSETFMPPRALSGNALQVRRFFVINERYGHVVVARTLPPESEFRLNISAIDGGELSDHITIRVFIKDVNDHFPMFKKSWYNFNVEEAQYSRRVLGKVDATDADFGQNANLTYFLQPHSKDLPFEISPLGGVLSINGELDREKEDKYTLTVVARDNGFEKKLTSSVSVEIQVLDINDNSPKFYGFDELLEWKHPEAYNLSNHNFESVMMIPVYKATLKENAPVGSVVTQVYANDSDFIGNGNGLILYSLPQRRNQMNIFTIDSKEGLITTTGRLDYESQSVHNVTVVASDLGSPSLSSTAIVMLTVQDVPDEMEMSDKPVFVSRYYELEIEENVPTPVELVTLNLTEYYENYKMKYFILNENDTDIKKTFVIDPRNGTLYLVRSPDREVRDMYEIIVRAERQKISREMPHMIYPVSDDVLEGMTKYDVKIIVRIKDVNDNAPKFINGGRPMVTAIPTTASYGYEVIRLQAVDADAGLNAEVRYHLMNSAGGRFSVESESGRVLAAGGFARDAGRVLGFDVKATDRRGADDGRSAIANVFVYVLDESKQLVLVVGAKPAEVEKQMANITRHLSNMTGYDIRVRRLEANAKSSMDGHATDMYVYGIDPLSNAIIDMEVLQKSIMKRETGTMSVGGFRVLGVGGREARGAGGTSGMRLPSSAQFGLVALAALVLLAAIAAALCILCKTTRRKRHTPYSQQRLNAFSNDHLTKYGGLFPSGGNQCQELNQSFSEADSYIDVINHSTLKKTCPHGNTVEEFGKAHQKCVKSQFGESSDTINQKHERMCIKFNQRPLQSRRGQDTSITSVNSSGQDSGIAEAVRCPCGHSTTHTSEESSGCSYEDSLKSNHNQESHLKSYRPDPEPRFLRRASFGHQPLDVRRFNNRRQSFSENLQRHFPSFERIGSGGRMTRQISSPNVSSVSQPYFLPAKKNLRRKEVIKEPVVDYDQSEAEDQFDTRLGRRSSGQNRKRGNFMELNGQTAVFVATPAAAEIMRRQGSERLMFARPI